MAFFSTLSSVPSPSSNNTVDLICIPAIGADPRTTWHAADGHGVFSKLNKAVPSIDIILYDHLSTFERQLEIKEAADPSHESSAKAFARAESANANCAIADWADRFTTAFWEDQTKREAEQRSIFFVCHSTGGVLLKQVLSGKADSRALSLTSRCIGIAFFAVPHHGSSVLSGPEYAQTVRDRLGLKWEMSEKLRENFALRSRRLKNLNYNFAKAVIGIKVFSYVETYETELNVLSNSDGPGESLLPLSLCIVDSRSAVLNSADVPVDEEDIISLNTTHVGAPHFDGQDAQCTAFVEKLASFVRSFNTEERAAYNSLTFSIMNDIHVSVHQFYQIGNHEETASIKVWSEYPSLQRFFELGPNECLKERLAKPEEQRTANTYRNARPKLEISPASEPAAPTITVTVTPSDITKESNKSYRRRSSQSAKTLSPESPAFNMADLMNQPLERFHTRRPSLPLDSGAAVTGHLAPKKPTSSNKASEGYEHSEKVDRLHRAHTYQLPTIASDRFRWVHVPFTNAGWVPQVLATISQEKGDLDLHGRFLLDQLWLSQHNRSRHSAPHARFVRPLVKCLFPGAHPSRYPDGPRTPASGSRGVQLVLYMPYLHWDNFENLKARARVIRKRLAQSSARPVDRNIATGTSIEHKLIWQYLTSHRPLHCRRTLDQYGYPSLRKTAVRDADQILYKRTKVDRDTEPPPTAGTKHSIHGSHPSSNHDPLIDSEQEKGAKVLMVDQLWLWIMDDQTVVSFAAPKEREDDEGLSAQGDLHGNIHRDVNGDYAQQCWDPFDFAALAVFHAVSALLDRTSDSNLQVFRIFEEYISILTERQNKSFKDFRNKHHGPVEVSVEQTPKQIDNRADLDALLELRDIEDELNTIGRVHKEQLNTVNEMIKQYEQMSSKAAISLSRDKGQNGLQLLHQVEHHIKDYQEQVSSMLHSAQAAQTAFKELLDMKQKQANIEEAQLARVHTEVAADQSRAVMIFTIFTIIFLPLSFFASIFGINAKEWSGVESNLALHTIFLYMGTISLAVILLSLLVAFNKPTRRLARTVWRRGARPLRRRLLSVFGIWRQTDKMEHDKVRLVEEALKGRRLETSPQGRRPKRQWTKIFWDEDIGHKIFG